MATQLMCTLGHYVCPPVYTAGRGTAPICIVSDKDGSSAEPHNGKNIAKKEFHIFKKWPGPLFAIKDFFTATEYVQHVFKD